MIEETKSRQSINIQIEISPPPPPPSHWLTGEKKKKSGMIPIRFPRSD